MSAHNVAVVRRLFQAVEDRDVEPMYGIYDPEVTITEAPSLPYGGTYHGHQGALEHGLGYLQAWEALQTEDDRRLQPRFACFEDTVLVRWRQKAHGPKGQGFDQPCLSVYELRGGKVVESTMHHLDTAALLGFLNSGR